MTTLPLMAGADAHIRAECSSISEATITLKPVPDSMLVLDKTIGLSSGLTSQIMDWISVQENQPVRPAYSCDNCSTRN
jgi:hypothetical protein